jgi:IS5 family transposase
VSRTTARQISFADWELLQQGDHGVRLEPLLQAISDFLNDQREMIEGIRRDLERGLKKPRSGRSGLTPSQILRSLVLMRGSKTGTIASCASGSPTG